MLPQRIIAIGASIVFGRIDSEYGGFVGRLKIWHEKNSAPNAVFNLGVSSNTSTMVLKRLYAEASVRNPDLIIVSIGLNDLKRRGNTQGSPVTPIKKFSKNINDIIRQSRKLCDILFVSITPVDENKMKTGNQKKYYRSLEDVKKYANMTKKICMREKVPYLDIISQWLQNDYQKFLTEDGVHPNSLGHKDIFLKLKAFLKKYYQG